MQTGLIHGARTRCEENSLCIVEFDGGVVGCVENSWAKLGGMEDRVEVCGTGGVVYADLFMGNSALTYSEKGYGYAMEKAGSTQGLDLHQFRGSLQPGIPAGAEALHRVRAERHAAAHDRRGRARRARDAERRVPFGTDRARKSPLPFRPKVSKPIDLWLGSANERSSIRLRIRVDRSRLFAVAGPSSHQAGFEDVPAVGHDARRTSMRRCRAASAAGLVSFERASVFALDEFGGLARGRSGQHPAHAAASID